MHSTTTERTRLKPFWASALRPGSLGIRPAEPTAGPRGLTTGLHVAIAGFIVLAACELLSGAIGRTSTEPVIAAVLGTG